MLLDSQRGRRFFFESSWLSEDKTVGALKSKLGVSELPVKMVESVEEQNELVSFIEPAPPVVVQVKLSHKAITAILAVNFGANAAALPIFLHFV